LEASKTTTVQPRAANDNASMETNKATTVTTARTSS
jgi:hypothetical protein